MDLSLNNLQRLICHKTQPTNKLLMSSWITQATQQYVEPFNFEQTNESCWVKLFVLNSNTYNEFTVFKQMNIIEKNY